MRVFLILLLLTVNSAYAIDFRELDKQYHFISGCGIQQVSSYVAKKNDMKHPDAVGFFVGASAGLLKEVADTMSPKDHTSDINDVTATVIGASFCTIF